MPSTLPAQPSTQPATGPTSEPAGPLSLVAFHPVIVDQNLPDDPYGIDIADMNKDGRPDIVLIRWTQVVWYESPDWKRHVIVDGRLKQNVSGGAYDVDEDGRLDVAVACDWQFEDTRTDGNVWWARHVPGEGLWPLFHFDEEPSIHRVRWVDVDGDGRKELLVAPLKGIATSPPGFSQRGILLYLMRIPPRPETDHWFQEVIDRELYVCHGAIGVQFDPDPPQEILTASFEGVHLFKRTPTGPWIKTRLCEGEQKTSPSRGSSEVSLGRSRSGRRIIATIEPWHGHEVVVYLEGEADGGLWPRYLLDDKLDQGHGVACVDLNGDGSDEIVAGYRGPNRTAGRPTSLKAYYAVDPQKGQWQTQWIDDGNMATEDLKTADMNWDGRPDVIACGRSTRNLKIYLNLGPR